MQIINSADRWIAARQLRNSLIHEYMTDPDEFAQAIGLANVEATEPVNVYNRILEQVKQFMQLPGSLAPLKNTHHDK